MQQPLQHPLLQRQLQTMICSDGRSVADQFSSNVAVRCARAQNASANLLAALGAKPAKTN